MSRMCVLGLGYVGLPLAVLAAERGFDVVGFDVSLQRVAQIRRGESPVEDVVDDRLRSVLSSGRFQATADPDDLARFDVAVISVPTPLHDDGPDVSHIERATESVGAHLRAGCTVILESTSYPGTTEEIVVPILERCSGLTAGADFHVGYSPERVDPGNRTWRLDNTPKIVSGIDAASLSAVREVFDRIVDRTVAVPGTKEAELAKLLENTFRHVNIALVNELAMFSHDLGIDIRSVIEAASSKPFGFMRFDPGPGTGGHCLPIDPTYLSWRVRQSLDQTFRFVELANDINRHMPDHVVRRVMLGLNETGRALRGSVIVLLGLSYKAGTADARESPAVRVAELLVDLGAEVRAADPRVPVDFQLPGVTRIEATEAELAVADAVVLLVNHPEVDPNMIDELTNPYVLDCRGVTRSSTIDRL